MDNINSNLIISRSIADSIALKVNIVENPNFVSIIMNVCSLIINCYKNDGKVLFCGNGGSAADAQHFAAELSGKFYIDRKPLYAEALHVNTSYITAVANDYSYDIVDSRLVEAKGRENDVLIAISTSGNSTNIINAINKANDIGMHTIGMTGESGGKMKDICSHILNVPSNDTPRIQEAHILIGHIICEIVESSLFANDK